MLRKDPFVTGEYYHIYNRGIDKRVIFKLKKDYERFIMLLSFARTVLAKVLRKYYFCLFSFYMWYNRHYGKHKKL
jgi:hypothetical protein